MTTVLLTNDEFRQLPEIKIKLYLKKHLSGRLEKLAVGSYRRTDDALANLVIPQADLHSLDGLHDDEQEMLLDAFTDALANLICLHEFNDLPINWNTLLL